MVGIKTQSMENIMATVSFAGTIGKDAELKDTSNGQIIKFSVAEEKYDFKQKEKVTIWRNCQMFGKNLSGVAKIFKKGNGIAVFNASWEENEYEGKIYYLRRFAGKH